MSNVAIGFSHHFESPSSGELISPALHSLILPVFLQYPGFNFLSVPFCHVFDGLLTFFVLFMS